MESGNRNQPKSTLQRIWKFKGVEQFLPKGRMKRMKRQGRALQRQLAALMAARHTGADAEEHTTAVVAVVRLVSPCALNSAPAVASLVFPGTAREHRAAVLLPSIPLPRGALTLAKDSVLLCPQAQEPCRTQTALHTQSQVLHSCDTIIKYEPIR